MWLKIFLNALAMVIVFSIQKSLIPYLPLGLGYLNLVIIVLISILSVFGARFAFVWFFFLAWLLDIFQFNLSGINFIAMFSVFWLCYFLLHNFITDRSLYSFLILTAVGTLLYDLILAISLLTNNSFQEIFRVYGKDLWLTEAKRLAANLILMIFIYNFFHRLTKRIEPVFLREIKKY